MIQEERAEIGGVATRAARTAGRDDLPAFLFLHGFSDSASGWRRLQRRLAEAGHTTLAVDQPSHGDADPVRSDEPVIPQFVDFAAAAATVTDEGRPVIVVGNSLGGAHALLLGQHHPDLVHGVVAISPASFDHPRWFGVLDDDSRAGRTLRRIRAQAEGRASRKTPNAVQRVLGRSIADGAIRNVAFGAPWRAPGGFVEDIRNQLRDQSRRDALHDLARQVHAEYFDATPVDLGAITVPVQAIWGTRDRLVKLSSRATLEAGLADLDFVALPSMGHMPQLEAPGRTAKHIRRFADRLAVRTPTD
ncbi:MAG: alpha/beta hydrolase [Acidimicrobiales bacterium]|nr:alpha/beta hydrolase [Acidimicrobiales bacterium]